MNLRPFTHMTMIAGISVLGIGVGLALSACGASSPSAAGAASSAPASSATQSAALSTAPAQPTSSPVATSAPAATGTPAAAPSAAFVPLQKFPDGIFLSPSGNINCEIDYHRAGVNTTGVYCQTDAPARSVKMDVNGKYTTCVGEQCLGNSDPQPTLAYGTATGAGPFRCISATTGITCLSNGKGFRISTSGVVPVSD